MGSPLLQSLQYARNNQSHGGHLKLPGERFPELALQELALHTS